MREIKFRVWDKKNNKMFDDITGEFINEIETTVNQTLDFVKRSGMVEVMQFTGLHDKNGKEIYEGDIVEGFLNVGITRGLENANRFQIVFREGCFIFDSMGIKLLEELQNMKECSFYLANNSIVEVIGNIYENKELLR